MKRLAIISHNLLRAIGFHKSRSPTSPYSPAPQGSQLITLALGTPELLIIKATKTQKCLEVCHYYRYAL